MLIRVEGSRPQGLQKKELIAQVTYPSLLGNDDRIQSAGLHLKPVHLCSVTLAAELPSSNTELRGIAWTHSPRNGSVG